MSKSRAAAPQAPGIVARVVERIAADPAPLIAAAAVLAVGIAMRDARLRRGGGRMLVLEATRRAVEGALGSGEGGGMAAAIPATAAWASGMLADRLFGAEAPPIR